MVRQLAAPSWILHRGMGRDIEEVTRVRYCPDGACVPRYTGGSGKPRVSAEVRLRVWLACQPSLTEEGVFTRRRAEVGGEGGIRTLSGSLESVTYRNHVAGVARNASVAVAPCALLHARPNWNARSRHGERDTHACAPAARPREAIHRGRLRRSRPRSSPPGVRRCDSSVPRVAVSGLGGRGPGPCPSSLRCGERRASC